MNASQSASQSANRSGKPKLAFRPLPVPQVDVRGFWGDRVDAVASRTADILYERCRGPHAGADRSRPAVARVVIRFHVATASPPEP
jgi:DUF1680 family protein